MSKKLHPAAFTSTPSIPSCTSGSGASLTRRSAGSIHRSTTIARIAPPLTSPGHRGHRWPIERIRYPILHHPRNAEGDATMPDVVRLERSPSLFCRWKGGSLGFAKSARPDPGGEAEADGLPQRNPPGQGRARPPPARAPPRPKRLAQRSEEAGVFLDPIITVRSPEGGFWSPNGRHRLAAARVLGLRAITALVSVDEKLAYRILALNTEKAHNLP